MEIINNPGKWSHYTYQQKYLKGKYLGHFTPGGATVVPANENGERKLGDWEFYYDGYNAKDVDLQNYVCVGANCQNPLPESRRGKLDSELLKRHGLTIEQVKYAMHYFFSTVCFQFTSQSYLVWEMTKECHSFSIIHAWTNVYAFSPERNWGRSYGHNFQSVSKKELVWWFGVLIQDGARGITGGAINRRWMMNDVDHDDYIMNACTPAG